MIQWCVHNSMCHNTNAVVFLTSLSQTNPCSFYTSFAFFQDKSIISAKVETELVSKPNELITLAWFI